MGPVAGGPPTGWGDGEAPDRRLTFGAWTLSLRGAEFADIDYTGSRVLRGIRFIVRDHDWRTADHEVVSVESDHRRLLLEVRSSIEGRALLCWSAELDCEAGLTISVRGRVLEEFRRNRIGLVVLHGPDLAGVPLLVRHPDGGVDRTAFPVAVAPHQPARDVTGYRWSNGGVDCELQLTGDVFEMEDQRNWTDASYKTYCTPLDLPFPVPVAAGEEIVQTVELRCRAAPSEPGSTAPGRRNRSMVIIPSADRLPQLRLGSSSAAESAPDAAVSPNPDPIAIMVEVPADDPGWPAVLARARRDAAGGDLDVRIVADSPDQVAPVVVALADLAVIRLGVYDRRSSRSTTPLMAALQRAVDGHGLMDGGGLLELVAGTRAHFTELNRTIDEFTEHRGGLTFSLTPQMHDRSRAQLIESLPIQRLIAEQAVRLAEGRSVHVGPVTLRPRFNAVATTTQVQGHQADEPADPRQDSSGVAAWTICSVAALAVPGIDTLTFFETWGPRGIRPAPGEPVNPAGRVLEWIRTAAALVPPPPFEVVDGPASAIGVLTQQLDRGRQLLIGNPGDRPVLLRLADGSMITVPAADTAKIILDR